MTRALLLVAFMLSFAAHAAQPQNYGKREDVRDFIREMVEKHGFVEKELVFLFSRTRREPAILAAIAPPKTAPMRSWQTYRGRFVTEARIAEGVEFWRKHAEALARATQELGVPEEIIVAIVGVETVYGRQMGTWRVIDALSTLAFDYPPRSAFFRSELEQYLLFARDASLDVFSVRGSYAGAIGIPQFMPGSYRRYAVDFDGDGAIDLRASPADAIGSVANFLKEHGWQSGDEVLFEAKLTGEAWRPLADGSVDPKHSLEELRKAGVEFAEAAKPARAALVELETPEQPSEFRVGLHNFYVLTRYNRSAFYAAAVHDLAQELKKAQVRGK